MSVCLLVSFPPNTFHNPLKSTKMLPCSFPVPRLVRCVPSTKTESSGVVSRRSADYKPCIWDNEYLQSLRNDYAGETYERRADKLKTDVKILIKNMVKHLNQFELIHVLQRLGLAYHFVSRRSADYAPCNWNNEYLQSLRIDYAGDTFERRAGKLKTDVKIMMRNLVKHLDRLELIDVLQRLGLAYHFEEEISKILESIFICKSNIWDGNDLYETALGFRLLRQHGYDIPQDVFKNFLNHNGSFDECIRDDVKGMLSLYEASYYSMENESILEAAWVFTHKHLKELIKSPTILKEENMDIVSHALNIPLHWRINRWEARWYIDTYERESGMNPIILELAKLDFNIVQTIHQQELRDLSRWWEKLGLGERLSFARDRLVEYYLWGVGINFFPQDGYCRKVLAAQIALITVIDDVYDVYGTLDELVLFTKAVESWDIKSIEELSDYMKLPFLALFNTVNEMAYDILKEQNIDVVPHLKKTWLVLLTTYLQEAKWYHTGYKPTLEEYMKNSRISIAVPLVDLLAYVSATKAIKKEALEFLETDPEIVRFTSTIFRFGDDLGTSKDELKRGDVPKAIECHMHDTGVSEEVSREKIKELIRQTWKKVNKYRVIESPLHKSMVEMILNVTRTSHMMYQYRDGHDNHTAITNIALNLLVEPIPL